MADDKGGGGGGSAWGPFEVILALLLGIGLLSQLQSGGIKPLVSGDHAAPATSIPEKKSETVAQSTCGLVVTRPKPLETVEGFISFTGTTLDCNWKSSDTVVLYAQVVDAKNKAVSDSIMVAATDIDSAGNASFDISIQIIGTPSNGVGYLTLRPENKKSTAQSQLNTRIRYGLNKTVNTSP